MNQEASLQVTVKLILYPCTVLLYSIACGQARISDAIEHLNKVRDNAFQHRKMINPPKDASRGGGGEDNSDEDDYEEEVSPEQVREVFQILHEGKEQSHLAYTSSGP